MTPVEIIASIRLPESIVVITDGELFHKLDFSLGDSKITIELKIDSATMSNAIAGLAEYDWAKIKCNSLQVLLEPIDCSDDGMLCLLGTHPNKSKFSVGGVLYQEATHLCTLLGELLLETVNRLLTIIRRRFGQYWLQNVEQAYIRNALFESGAKWRVEKQEWRQLAIGTRSQPPNRLGGGLSYVTPTDWQSIQRALADDDEVHLPFELMSDARNRFAAGDRLLAFVQLNAAIEWSARTFVGRNCVQGLPPRRSDPSNESELWGTDKQMGSSAR